jgi:DNA-directed RNA polymerase specialized sigma24 family protein
MNANGHKRPDRTRAPDDGDASAERWIENSAFLATPFDYDALESEGIPRPVTVSGAFWEVLNNGIAQKVQQTVIALFQLFLTLPPEEQKAFVLRTAQKLSFREIAAILGVTHPTAHNLYDQALKKISAFTSGKNVTASNASGSVGALSKSFPIRQ